MSATDVQREELEEHFRFCGSVFAVTSGDETQIGLDEWKQAHVGARVTAIVQDPFDQAAVYRAYDLRIHSCGLTKRARAELDRSIGTGDWVETQLVQDRQ